MTEDRAGDGCATCRAGWITSGTIADTLGVSPHLQTYIHRCATCGTLWESVISNHPRPVSERRAATVLEAPDFEPW